MRVKLERKILDTPYLFATNVKGDVQVCKVEEKKEICKKNNTFPKVHFRNTF